MTTITIDDQIIKDLRKSWVKDNPYDTDKKSTHIVREVLIQFIKNNKKSE